MLGFINGLALVVGRSQLEAFQTEAGGWLPQSEMTVMVGLTAITMAIIAVWERIGKAVPAPLLAVIATTGLTWFLGLDTKCVGDLADIGGALPSFHIPEVPATLATFKLVLPCSLSLAAVGLIQSLLTQQLVDELLDTRTQTGLEARGQGLANVRSPAAVLCYRASHHRASTFLHERTWQYN